MLFRGGRRGAELWVGVTAVADGDGVVDTWVSSVGCILKTKSIDWDRDGQCGLSRFEAKASRIGRPQSIIVVKKIVKVIGPGNMR